MIRGKKQQKGVVFIGVRESSESYIYEYTCMYVQLVKRILLAKDLCKKRV
jgi:hypothetical protein